MDGSPVTLQPSCVRARRRKGKRDWNPAAAGGVAAGHGLAKAVGGAAAHRGGSDGRDVVGGGCMPLLARAPATNDHPWSIHGGFICQVRPTRRASCCYRCCPLLCRVRRFHLSRHRKLRPESFDRISIRRFAWVCLFVLTRDSRGVWRGSEGVALNLNRTTWRSNAITAIKRSVNW